MRQGTFAAVWGAAFGLVTGGLTALVTGSYTEPLSLAALGALLAWQVGLSWIVSATHRLRWALVTILELGVAAGAWYLSWRAIADVLPATLS